MKITWLPIIALSAIIACNREGKEADVPAAVTNAFKAKYPNAVAKEWEKEDDAFEAKTTLNNMEYEVAFDATGKWMETERDIKVEEIPQVVTDSLAASVFKDWEIKEVVEIESPAYKLAYEIGIAKGKEKKSLYFTPDGALVKAEAETDVDEDDEKEDKD